VAKTKVLTAPWHPVTGSLLHYPTDCREFTHYEDPETGEMLTEEQIWEPMPPRPEGYDGWWNPTRKLIRDYKRVFTEADWRPNEPFHASLQIKHMMSGRSAKYLILGPVNSPLDVRTYPMFVSDLIDVAQRFGVRKGGIMSGRWMVSGRGANYGLRAAKEDE
jgi:hypothetical protein